MIFGGIQDIFQANILSTRGFCIYWLSCPIILKKVCVGIRLWYFTCLVSGDPSSR